MRPLALILVIALTSLIQAATACSPAPGWLPPTPTSAFSTSQVVIHAKILSQQADARGNHTTAIVAVKSVMKGTFSGSAVETASPSLCGIGSFEVGREYVFFFSRTGYWFVSGYEQPENVATEEVLSAIGSLKK